MQSIHTEGLPVAPTREVPRPQWPPCPPVNGLPQQTVLVTAVKFLKCERKRTSTKEALFFDIQVTRGADSYVITRRFAHLKLMHEWISAYLPEIKLPSLPSKLSTFFKSSSDESKSRQTALQACLTALIGHPQLQSLAFLNAFLDNRPEVEPAQVQYPDVGTLYVNVWELVGCNSFGAVCTRTWPVLSFNVACGTPQFTSSPVSPGEKIFGEYFCTVQRPFCTTFIQLVNAKSQYAGCFADIDVSKLAPFQMYDCVIPLKGSNAPPGAGIRVLVQFSPSAIPKLNVREKLNPLRIQLHKDTWFPGDTLRGSVFFANPKPCAIESCEIGLSCVQSLGWTLAKPAINYTNYVTITERAELASARRQLVGAPGIKGVLHPGFYVWPFEILIPKDAPPTCMGFGDIVQHANSNFNMWMLSFKPGIPSYRNLDLPIYVVTSKEPNPEKKSTIGFMQQRVKFEDLSNLPPLLIIGQTYNFHFRVTNVCNKGISKITLKWRSGIHFHAHGKSNSSNSDYTGVAMANDMQIKTHGSVSPQHSADFIFTFTIPLNAMPDLHEDTTKALLSTAYSGFNFEASMSGIFDWEWGNISYELAAPTPNPTRLYSRPGASYPKVRPGALIKPSLIGLECPMDHPHFPFAYLSPLPAQPLKALGRTPLRPATSWFFPMQMPAGMPVAPTNIIMAPESDFAPETIVLPFREPAIDVALSSLQHATTQNPEDAQLCEALIAAVKQRVGDILLQQLDSVQSQVCAVLSSQSIHATSDDAIVEVEETERKGEGSSTATAAAPSVTAPVATDAPAATPVAANTPTEIPTTASIDPGQSPEQASSTEQTEPAMLQNSNQIVADRLPLTATHKHSISLRQSMKMSRPVNPADDLLIQAQRTQSISAAAQEASCQAEPAPSDQIQ